VVRNYIDPREPSLPSSRDVQKVQMTNTCGEPVWAFLMDRANKAGEGGLVEPGEVHEFVFFDKGNGWMTHYHGCIMRYDVDRQCVGKADGLGDY
jgi:hypothetical protein